MSVLVGILGPTGSGKSALACELARRFEGEVVSCDALQVYRGVDVGTGKLSPAERRGVPHHLLDVSEPDREFSAADYMRQAARAVSDVTARGRLPLVVGGTGLYFRALVRGLLDGPGRDRALRARLHAIADRRGSAFLHALLERVDRASAARLHRNDKVRIVRALEITFGARRPMSELMAEHESLQPERSASESESRSERGGSHEHIGDEGGAPSREGNVAPRIDRSIPLPGYRVLRVGLAPPREELARRIACRVARMFESGLVEEARRLAEDYGPEAPAFKAIGYREALRHLRGELSLEEALRLTVQASRQYAKRQMTWFRAEPDVHWIFGAGEAPEVVEAAALHLARRFETCPGEERCHAETTR